jgi:hypothetical protein
MNPFRIGTEVSRNDRAPYLNSRGTVVEINCERCQVFWHTPTFGKPKRTWVRHSILVDVDAHRLKALRQAKNEAKKSSIGSTKVLYVVVPTSEMTFGIIVVDWTNLPDNAIATYRDGENWD